MDPTAHHSQFPCIFFPQTVLTVSLWYFTYFLPTETSTRFFFCPLFTAYTIMLQIKPMMFASRFACYVTSVFKGCSELSKIKWVDYMFKYICAVNAMSHLLQSSKCQKGNTARHGTLSIISTNYLPLFCYVSIQELYSSWASFVAWLRHLRRNYAVLIQRLLRMWPADAAFQFEGCTTWILRGPAYIKWHRGPASSLSSSDKILAGYTVESETALLWPGFYIFTKTPVE